MKPVPARLPRVARWLLALAPLGDRRADVESDLAELFTDRRGRYGRFCAWRRLIADIVSLWRSVSRGGSVLLDLRFALRLMRKHPAPIAIAVGGLGLAIGLVTSMFSLVDATLLRPYKMTDPSSVVTVVGRDHHWSIWPYADFARMRAQATLTTLIAIDTAHVRFGTAADQDSADAVGVQFVSGGYMQTLGGRAALGRSLVPSDDEPGASPVAVVSRHFWTTHLGGDAGAIGRTIWLNGSPVTMVGVIDSAFVGPVKEPIPLWTTFASYDDLIGGSEFTAGTRSTVGVFGRLTPGAGMAAAQDELSAIVASLPDARPVVNDAPASSARLYSSASPMSGPDGMDNAAAAAATLAVGGLVLLLACANAANLLLAGAVTRTREIGVRLALGATRWRLMRQLLSEGLLLGGLSGVVGLILSVWAVPVLAGLAQLPADIDMPLDVRVFIFAASIAMACGLGASIAPARFGARGRLNSHGRTGEATPRSARLRTSFVALQAAVSMLMLVIALLLTRTALVMTSRGPGFDVNELLAVTVTMPQTGVDQRAYFRSAIDAVRGLPSIESVSLTQDAPFGFTVEIERFGISNRAHALYVIRSDAGYFRTTGVRVVRGRSFTESEIATEAPVALISDSVAREFFAGQDPIGQPLDRIPSETGPEQHAVIIGVAADAITSHIYTADYGEVYRPIKSRNANPPVLIVRAGRPLVVARAIERTMQAIDPRVRVTSALVGRAANEYFDGTRLRAILGVTIASVAFALSILGVYGVTAFVVSQRTHEVGVRIALGATGGGIMAMLVRQSLRPVLIGASAGLMAAMVAGQFLSTLFAGVSPRDPIAIGAAAAALVTGSLAAIFAPARRATSVSPTDILKEV